MNFEEERQEKEKFLRSVKYARSRLYDYYGTAAQFMPAASGDLIRLERMSPEEILDEAHKLGLI